MPAPALSRREFVARVGGAAAAATVLGPLAWAGAQHHGGALAPFILSTEGCGRATGYGEATKIVTVGDRTHVTWLDGTKDGFFVRVRTLDRRTGEWSPAVTVGEGQDNHADPCLIADSRGFLHIVYYPHHAPFRYRRSVRPNDSSAWTPEERFAESVSYAVMLCAPDDTLVLTCRRYYTANDRLNEVELWNKPAGGAWARQGVILRARFLDYAHFQESLAWGRDGRTIHLSCRIYETNPVKGAKPIETRGYLVSPDAGKTWQRSDGARVELPATADTVEVLESGGGATGKSIYAGAIAVSPRGVPHLLHSVREKGAGRSFLLTPQAGGGWARRGLHEFLPAAYRDWDMTMTGGVTFSESGRLTIVAQVVKLGPDEQDWGAPTTEIVRLWSDDEWATFRSEVLEPVDAKEPHWLPNVERASGHNRVPDVPGIIYTAGATGGGLKDLGLGNKVWWRPGNF